MTNIQTNIQKDRIRTTIRNIDKLLSEIEDLIKQENWVINKSSVVISQYKNRRVELEQQKQVFEKQLIEEEAKLLETKEDKQDGKGNTQGWQSEIRQEEGQPLSK